MKFKIVEEAKKVKPEDFGITKYKFRPDGTLDVFQDVNLWGKYLTELPFKFGKVDGYFACNKNELKSLKGAPKVVNAHFDCSDNYLTSLKYAPNVINDYFNCSWNKLKSLEGAPKIMNGDFYCFNNKLKDLKGAPKVINGDFNCGWNNKLKSLDGLNLNRISGKIYLRDNPNLKLTEKEEFWATLNPGRLILKK